MKRKILFSPVGGTDPMSQSNFRDGSLLHICRVYQPTDIYLYMSAEILELHHKDDRYLYCLRKLAERQKREMRIELIERSELKNVQNFDTFYQDFRSIIRKIVSAMDDTDELIFNVSSGTPAMKSGLVVLATLGEHPYRLIQVKTPVGKMNEHTHKNYDVETLWALNEDNEEGFENRCLEIHCPSLSIVKQEEMIKELVNSYDYEAARNICKSLPENVTQNYRLLLDLACARLHLDMKEVDRLEKETRLGCIPVKESGKRKVFEYALGMDIKQRKCEYTDFIRAITPLILELFMNILKTKCKIDIEKDYGRRKKNTNTLRWDREKLEGTELDHILQNSFPFPFNYAEVYSVHLLYIIKAKCSNDKVLCDSVEQMRRIEESVRNPAAHELVSLSDKKIKEKTGCDTAGIMNIFRKLFHYAGFVIRQEDWDSYQTMNEKIIQRMEKGI